MKIDKNTISNDLKIVQLFLFAPETGIQCIILIYTNATLICWLLT